MQTMEMGSAEAALSQVPATAPPTSSSYFLQLDPSGHIDILESSLVLSEPKMPEETVYEIQLDQFVMEDRNNVEINMQNLQNLHGTFTFQPEFLENRQQPNQTYTTTYTFAEPPPIQFHIDDAGFNQMLFGNSATIITAPPYPPLPTYTFIKPEEKPAVVEDDGYVPEFTIETEVIAEINEEQVAPVASRVTKESQYEAINGDVKVGIESKSLYNGEMNVTDDEEDTSATVTVEPEVVVKREKRYLPDKIMEFTEEAVIPPLIEIFPSPKDRPMSPVLPQIVNLSEDDMEDIDTVTDVMVPQFLPEGVDPDDELYISYLSRPDLTKTVLCILCYDWFDDKQSLEDHLKSVHQNNMKLYACKRCGQQFWSRFLRQRHEKTHRYDLKGPLHTNSSKRQLSNSSKQNLINRLRPAPFTKAYRDHLRVLYCEIKSTEFECFECNEDFRTEEEYAEHYEEYHAIQTCITCRKQFENSQELRKHELDFHGKFTFPKQYPGGAWKLWDTWESTDIKDTEDRVVDVYLHHNYSKKVRSDLELPAGSTESKNCDTFAPMDCEEITVSKNEASKIIQKRKSDKLPRIKSPGGGSSKSGRLHPKGSKRSKSKESRPPKMEVDIKIEEEVEINVKAAVADLPFSCEQCKTFHETEADLQRHLKTHTIRSMAYMCQYCGRGFATHSNRKEHERIHTGDKPYVCPICTRAFVQISNLKKHIQTHKDKNNLQCTQCQKQFVKESSLILHQRAHSQDRKFRCHVCDRAYNYASLLKRHMRIHTGENPYSCEDCGMMFHELVSLHYHRKKVHTGERPHRCEFCDRAFILSSDLKKHLKIHARDGTCAKATTKTYSRSSKHGKTISVAEGETAAALLKLNEDLNKNGNCKMDEVTDVNFLSSQSQNYNSPVEKTASLDLIKNETNENVPVGQRVLVVQETDLLKSRDNAEVIKNETNITNNCIENHVNTDGHNNSVTDASENIL